MSSKPSSAVKPEVALNGVVKIPKAVFESLPPPAEKKAGVIGAAPRASVVCAAPQLASLGFWG